MSSILGLEASILDHAFEGIQVLDSSYRYQFINTTAAAHGRRSRETLLGRLMTDEYPGIERTGMFQALTRCMQERTPERMTNLFDYPGGGAAWFELTMLPVPEGVVILSLDVSERKAAEQKLELLRAESLIDPLTGLYNRRFLTYALDRELVLAKSFGMLMIDVDQFKTYNDTFGHVAGDDVLRAVGRTVLACVRGSDTACRYGGDEMAVLLPGATLETSRARAEEIRERVVRWTRPRDASAAAPVTVSVGVAAHPEHGRSAVDLINAADRALYAAKRAGRNRVALAPDLPK